MAGLNRLGFADMATPIPLDDMLPAAGQGILGVVIREDAAPDLNAALAQLNVAASEAAATAERAFLAKLDGSCRTPIAAHLSDEGELWRLTGEVLSVRGENRWRASGTASKDASPSQLAALGIEVATEILDAAQGALPLFGDDQ
jgi:hydroxymethylbilane synthase